MAMALILLADEVAVPLCRGEAFNPASFLEPIKGLPLSFVQEEQQDCVCSKIICFHNTQIICFVHLGTTLQCRCVVEAEELGGIPIRLSRSELLPPWGL